MTSTHLCFYKHVLNGMGIYLHQKKKTETSKTCIFLKLFKQDEGNIYIYIAIKQKKMIINGKIVNNC
jgi:hypothetical protein